MLKLKRTIPIPNMKLPFGMWTTIFSLGSKEHKKLAANQLPTFRVSTPFLLLKAA
jgi:thiamine phosphate synthase YjbQ (UPF0047 family)